MTIDARESLAITASRLFFIVGSGRSGTTLMRRMLNNHTGIYIPTETHYFTIFRTLHRLRYPVVSARNYDGFLRRIDHWAHAANEGVAMSDVACLAKLGEPRLETPYVSFMDICRRKHKASLVGDNTPSYVRMMPQLRRHFPEARFIHMIRDPRDVVASYREHSTYRSIYGSNVVRAALKSRRALKAHFEFLDRDLARWSYLHMQYEDLVRNPEQVMRVVTAFLGLSYEEDMLRVSSLSTRIPNPEDHEYIFRPVVASRVGRWKEALTNADVALIELIVGNRMCKVGYESTFDARRRLQARMLLPLIEAAYRYGRHGIARLLRGR